MKKTISLFALLILTFQSANAVKEYYSVSRSLRALGMGGAFYGLSDDEGALFYNPAGLSLYRNSWQFGLPINIYASQNVITDSSTVQKAVEDGGSVGQILNQLSSVQGKPFYAGFGLFPHYVQKNFGIGFLIADTKVNLALLGKEFDTSLEATAISDSGIVMGYAQTVGREDIHVGVTAKFLARAGGRQSYEVLEIAQNGNFATNLEDLGGVGGGFDLDLGVMYELPELKEFPPLVSSRIGLTFNNLLATNFPISRRGSPPQLSRTMSLGGAAIFKGWGVIDNFIVVFDLAEFNLGGQTDPDFGARVGSFWKHVNFGVEIPMRRWFALRTGFRQGLFSAGLGINVKYFKLDLAWYAEELARNINRLNARRIGLRITLGGGDWYPRPITETRAETRRRGEELRRKRLEQMSQDKLLTPEQKNKMNPVPKDSQIKNPMELDKKKKPEQAPKKEEPKPESKPKEKREPQSEESTGQPESNSENSNTPDEANDENTTTGDTEN